MKVKGLKGVFSNSKEIADENDIYLIRDLMKSVVDNGTGGSIRWKYKFYAPAAGKTGTTNSKTDAWFVGFTPQITIGVWVGVDDQLKQLGKQYGSNAALPIFAQAIKNIYNQGYYQYLDKHKGKDLDVKLDWDIPEEIVSKNICKILVVLKQIGVKVKNFSR